MSSLSWGEKIIDFDKIVVDPELQIRVSLSEDRISDFAEIYDQLPPIKIVKVENDLLLSDGFHRYRAAERRKLNQMKALVTGGTYRDALMVAIESNVKSSLPLTREDKRKAIAKLLKFSPDMANSWIAEKTGSSMQTVESVRVSLEKSGEIQALDEFQKRDGKITPRKYTTTSKGSDDELRDIARIASTKEEHKSGVSKIADDIRETVLGTSVKDRSEPRKVVDNNVSERIETGFDIILQEPVDLPIGIYRLIISKEKGDVEIRLYSVDGDDVMPTTIGIKGDAAEMSNKLLVFSV